MSSQSYWEKRKAQEMFEYMEEAEQAADEISKAYHKASRYISLELDEIFERFQTKHGLTEAEARRLMNTIQDTASLDEWKRALKAGTGDKSKEELLALLESPAYQARIERLQQMQNQIYLTMKQVYKQEKDFSTSFYTDLANESYYKSIFGIQQRTGLGFGFDLLSPDAIDMMLNSKWSGENYSSRVWKNTGALARDLKEELLINMMTGRTDQEVADIIANKFAQGASNARRLVRTESCNLSNQMEMRSYEECGIETYIFVATLDLKTSSACQGLDGKRFEVSEQQPGVNCPPMHPWCRSTTICDITDDELSQMKRRARNPETGKNETVPANMTYEKWHKEKVEGHPDAVLNEKKLKNRDADRKQYEKYKTVYGKDIPDSFDKFQELKYNDIEKWESLKTGKQDKMNQMDFSEMDNLKGTLGNKETRLWYKAHDEGISGKIDTTKPIKEQAEQAHTLRNEYRTQARDLMKDQKARQELDEKHPNPSFEQIMEHKKMKYGLTDDEAYRDIVRSSGTTNKKYDKIAGVEEG